MLVYVVDGSFEGILTAVYEAYARHERPEQILPAHNLAVNFLDRYVQIPTESKKSEKICQAILTRISEDAYRTVQQIFLADYPDQGTLINNYLRLGFRLGPSVDDHLHEDCVFKVLEISRKVTREVHRFVGLLRFVQTKWGIYYAKFEPDHNITQLLAPHFADRLSDQNWIIHDTRRGIAAMYNKREWMLTELSPEALPDIEDCEEIFLTIWKAYHQNISIAERKNLKLQKNLMPARYWKNLTEMTSPDILAPKKMMRTNDEPERFV